MNGVRVVLLVFFIGISAFFPFGGVCAEMKPIAPGDVFPDLSFRDVLSKGDRSYIGIGKKKTFSVKDMRGSIFIFEIFSTYCMTCPRNVPVINTLYSMVNGDPRLKEKVKVLSVAVGNTAKEVESYRQEHKVLYPVLTDFSFVFHKTLGNPRVPFTIIVRREARGKYVVVYTYLGVIESTDNLLKEIRKLLR